MKVNPFSVLILIISCTFATETSIEIESLKTLLLHNPNALGQYQDNVRRSVECEHYAKTITFQCELEYAKADLKAEVEEKKSRKQCLDGMANLNQHLACNSPDCLKICCKSRLKAIRKKRRILHYAIADTCDQAVSEHMINCSFIEAEMKKVVVHPLVTVPVTRPPRRVPISHQRAPISLERVPIPPQTFPIPIRAPPVCQMCPNYQNPIFAAYKAPYDSMKICMRYLINYMFGQCQPQTSCNCPDSFINYLYGTVQQRPQLLEPQQVSFIPIQPFMNYYTKVIPMNLIYSSALNRAPKVCPPSYKKVKKIKVKKIKLKNKFVGQYKAQLINEYLFYEKKPQIQESFLRLCINNIYGAVESGINEVTLGKLLSDVPVNYQLSSEPEENFMRLPISAQPYAAQLPESIQPYAAQVPESVQPYAAQLSESVQPYAAQLPESVQQNFPHSNRYNISFIYKIIDKLTYFLDSEKRREREESLGNFDKKSFTNNKVEVVKNVNEFEKNEELM